MSDSRRSVPDLLAPLIARAKNHSSLLYDPLSAELPRFTFHGPAGGDQPIRIGIFAAIHGDEAAAASGTIKFLELLDLSPELARDFSLFIYPLCNPTGYEDNTRHSRSGRDLNREFWKNSAEPEVCALETELSTHRFDGIIALHTDDTSHGIYGFVGGATLTKSLLEPALRAAELFLPRNEQPMIDGFNAQKGIIHEGYQGILSAPPNATPRPFELIFETPQLAPIALQEHAFIVALLSILAEYRKTISYAANL
jgi:protein MpaA